jgi:hypothetical protein
MQLVDTKMHGHEAATGNAGVGVSGIEPGAACS